MHMKYLLLLLLLLLLRHLLFSPTSLMAGGRRPRYTISCQRHRLLFSSTVVATRSTTVAIGRFSDYLRYVKRRTLIQYVLDLLRLTRDLCAGSSEEENRRLLLPRPRSIIIRDDAEECNRKYKAAKTSANCKLLIINSRSILSQQPISSLYHYYSSILAVTFAKN